MTGGVRRNGGCMKIEVDVFRTTQILAKTVGSAVGVDNDTVAVQKAIKAVVVRQRTCGLERFAVIDPSEASEQGDVGREAQDYPRRPVITDQILANGEDVGRFHLVASKESIVGLRPLVMKKARVSGAAAGRFAEPCTRR